MTTISSAQLEMLPAEGMGESPEDEAARPGGLRQEAAKRLAAHRLRRGRHGRSAGEARTENAQPAGRNRIAAAVAERYAQTPSYRAFLAEEAERAVRQAAAAAEVAARNAQAVAAVQQELLAELELWVAPQEFTAETAVTIRAEESAGPEAGPGQTIRARESRRRTCDAEPLQAEKPVEERATAGLTVRLYEDLGRAGAVGTGAVGAGAGRHAAVSGVRAQQDVTEQDREEALALDEEIAFRQAPVFEDYRDPGGSVEPIAANLVEFPRQLVAAKKARPRLAEGPLREDGPRSPQLRIFEVEPEQISQVPASPAASPEWTSIRLEAHSMIGPAEQAESGTTAILPSLLPPQTAPMSLRAMAVAVDGVLVLAAFVAFVAAAAKISGTVPTGIPAAVAAAATIAVFYLGYLTLFFTFSEQTPGMRYARIGLCTFMDENPTRKAMRQRILALVIAACPLGIGLLWMWLDDDRLGWHDRISRMYQRAY